MPLRQLGAKLIQYALTYRTKSGYVCLSCDCRPVPCRGRALKESGADTARGSCRPGSQWCRLRVHIHRRRGAAALGQVSGLGGFVDVGGLGSGEFAGRVGTVLDDRPHGVADSFPGYVKSRVLGSGAHSFGQAPGCC